MPYSSRTESHFFTNGHRFELSLMRELLVLNKMLHNGLTMNAMVSRGESKRR